MADGLKMQYGDMLDCCGQLEGIADEILTNKENMTNKVNALCDAWEAEASPVYQEDYQNLAKSIDQIGELVKELTGSIRSYVADMQQLDGSYAKR